MRAVVGKFTVKAEFVSFDQEVVSLRRANGKTIKVPLAKLSKEDQRYVLAEPKPKADPVAALEELGARVPTRAEVGAQYRLHARAIELHAARPGHAFRNMDPRPALPASPIGSRTLPGGMRLFS